ncbi:MAG: COX15/CtaA family protein [Beijerinckiaceae bacterium]
MLIARAARAPDAATAPDSFDRHAAVRQWLWLTVGLVLLMVLVGGATRLTGSGLSITEWRPVSGALPPLSAAEWQAEFDRYRAIPQYELMNKGMTLAQFQFIYWWEWGHRQLGRFIGVFYLAGFLWFAVRRAVPLKQIVLLFGMGLLLALQGAVGWIMVASGLKPGMTAVAPVKLMLHLMFATLFLASLVAMATYLKPQFVPPRAVPGRVRTGAWIVLIMTLVQIALGALVAGSKAGLIYNTWPLMDGTLAPPLAKLLAVTPWYENFVDNLDLVQLNHRLGAYLLAALAVWHMISARRMATETSASRRATALMMLVATQFVLGIVTLMLAVPLWAGLAHQGLAMIVVIMAVAHVVRCVQAARPPVLRPVHE